MFLRSVASAPAWVVAVVVLFTAGPPAQASPVLDPTGDFLPSYLGPQSGGLDVVWANVTLNGNQIVFDAVMAGPIAPPSGVWQYVFGINRGAGTEVFLSGNPPIGQGVRFDSVGVIRSDGTGSAGLTDIVVSGNTIHGVMPLSSFPSTGFLPQNYTWNLWPRSPGVGNPFISDFAPNASNAAITVTPEPTSLMVFGLVGLAGLGWRRFRTAI